MLDFIEISVDLPLVFFIVHHINLRLQFNVCKIFGYVNTKRVFLDFPEKRNK